MVPPSGATIFFVYFVFHQSGMSSIQLNTQFEHILMTGVTCHWTSNSVQAVMEGVFRNAESVVLYLIVPTVYTRELDKNMFFYYRPAVKQIMTQNVYSLQIHYRSTLRDTLQRIYIFEKLRSVSVVITNAQVCNILLEVCNAFLN